MASTSTSPCAACKFLRRKCTYECVFAPYFPPDQPQKFSNVHKVFGASNVTKLLNELTPNQREDAVNSLAYEAEARLRDPVYGCVGLISVLQQKLRQVQVDLFTAKKELANYIGPSAMLPAGHQHYPIMNPTYGSSASIGHNGMTPMGLGFQVGPSSSQAHLHQQMIEAQQMAAAREQQQQELIRNLQRQQQQEIARFNRGFDQAGRAVAAFDPMGANVQHELVSFEAPMPLQTQPQNQPQQLERTGSYEGRGAAGPSSQ